MRNFNLLLLALLITTASFAQSFLSYNYTTQDGLPSNEVYDIFQDREGFLWFATDNGVAKFDGSSMQNFHLKDGLTDPVVFSFFQDSKHRIWFRTFSGNLAYYENKSIQPYKYNRQLQKDAGLGDVIFIYDAEQERLHYGIRGSYCQIDSTGNLTKERVPRKTSIAYKTLKDGCLIIPANAKIGTVTYLSFDSLDFPVEISDTSSHNKVVKVLEHNKDLYVSLFNEVYKFDGKTVTKVFSATGSVISLSVDRQDNFWIGVMNQGVFYAEKGDFKSVKLFPFLVNKSVTKVFQGAAGDLWFSTLEHGIYKVPNVAISTSKLELNKIKAVAANDRHVFIGDQNGALLVYDIKSKKLVAEKKLSSSLISLFCDRHSNLWASDHSKIHKYDPNLNLVKQYINKNSSDYYEDEDGSVWFNGTLRIGKINTANKLVLYDTVLHVYRNMLIHGEDVYLGRRIGFDIRKKSNLHIKRVPKEFSNVKVSEIAKLNDSTLVIATIGNGFSIYQTRTGRYKTFDKEHNFFASNIYAVLVRDNLVWLGTDQGVARISADSIYSDHPSFDYITNENGLLNKQVNFLLADANSIWAIAPDGFSIIPKDLRLTEEQPKFYIDYFRVNDFIASSDMLQLLHYDHNNLEIKYRIVSFTNPFLVVRFKFEHEDIWQTASNNKISFSALAPGRYSLLIQHSPDGKVWTESIPPVRIHIRPPWWKRWYTYAAGAFIVALIAYSYVNYQRKLYLQRSKYLRIINDHQQKLIQSEIVTLERERNRIAKELHDGVGTNLTAIKLMVNQLLNHHRDPLANDVEEQFQVALKEIKNIIYGLTPPTLERYGLFTGLKNYVSKLNKSIPIHIDLKTFGPEQRNYDLNIMIYRIVQELITNSIKHSHAKNITIHISSFDDVLNIVYEDDGIGFSYNPVEHGLGLDNIESRIRSVNGTLKFESGKFGISYTLDVPIASAEKAKSSMR